MSLELLQMIETLNKEDLRTQLALQCAPVIKGIKISNLLVTDVNKQIEIEKHFRNKKLSYFLLFNMNGEVIYLLYDKNKLEMALNKPGCARYLQRLGYPTEDLVKVLEQLRVNYTNYRSDKGPFPHEMGIVLGYPLSDVLSFIHHKGKNFLYRGYWKVYSNLQEAKKLFNQYNQAKEELLHLLVNGFDLYALID